MMVHLVEEMDASPILGGAIGAALTFLDAVNFWTFLG
jgi:hypothetical protein